MAAGAFRLGDKLPDFELPQLDGGKVRLADLVDGKHFVVVNWHSSACPCAANCASLIATMMKSGYDDVRFVGIDSDADLKREWALGELRNQVKDGIVTFPVLLDHDQSMMKRFGAKRTPTVWVLDKDGRIAYWGAPENTLEPTLKEHRFLLREAIDALRKGAKPSPATFPPLGCPIYVEGSVKIPAGS